MNMANDLLATACQQERDVIDEKLCFEVFALDPNPAKNREHPPGSTRQPTGQQRPPNPMADRRTLVQPSRRHPGRRTQMLQKLILSLKARLNLLTFPLLARCAIEGSRI